MKWKDTKRGAMVNIINFFFFMIPVVNVSESLSTFWFWLCEKSIVTIFCRRWTCRRISQINEQNSIVYKPRHPVLRVRSLLLFIIIILKENEEKRRKKTRNVNTMCSKIVKIVGHGSVEEVIVWTVRTQNHIFFMRRMQANGANEGRKQYERITPNNIFPAHILALSHCPTGFS